MIGFIKYINYADGYGYISVQDRGMGDIPFRFTDSGGLRKDDTVSFELCTALNGKEYAKNIVKQQRNDALFSTEDKQKWVEHGLGKEYDFVRDVVPRFHGSLVINPEKQKSPYVIDLYDEAKGSYADLKTQETPFFLARKKYGFDPQYTVTFNYKDYKRYSELYPDCDIYFHVFWQQLERYGVRVEPMEGVWVARFRDMRALIESGAVPLHPYQFRVNDEINARDSYLFDLNHEIFTKLFCC